MNKAFFDAVRSNRILGARKLTQVQVRSAEEIIAAGQRLGLPLNQVAYILATAWHEAKLTPKRESLYYTTAKRLMEVWPSRFKTVASATPYLKNEKKLANFVYGGRLGNRAGTDDGYIYRGGGLDQLTGLDNYKKVGINHRPESIIDPVVAVSSLVQGMTTGRYRGVKLSDHVNASKTDYVSARDVINADKNRKEGSTTVGQLVASYARAFEAALTSGGYSATPPRPVAKPSNPVTAGKIDWNTIIGIAVFLVVAGLIMKIILGN